MGNVVLANFSSALEVSCAINLALTVWSELYRKLYSEYFERAEEWIVENLQVAREIPPNSSIEKHLRSLIPINEKELRLKTKSSKRVSILFAFLGIGSLIFVGQYPTYSAPSIAIILFIVLTVLFYPLRAAYIRKQTDNFFKQFKKEADQYARAHDFVINDLNAEVGKVEVKIGKIEEKFEEFLSSKEEEETGDKTEPPPSQKASSPTNTKRKRRKRKKKR